MRIRGGARNKASASVLASTIASVQGFTLTEMLVAMTVASVVLSGAVFLFAQALQGSFSAINTSDAQQNARAAMNLMHRDFSLAGTGMPQGGIQLPSGTNATASLFGCDGSQCYLQNGVWPSNHLYSVMPDQSDPKLPAILGIQTQSATVVYVDPAWQHNPLPILGIGLNATSLTLDSRINPASSTQGLQTGDIMMVSNPNGSAMSVVTNVTGSVVSMSDHDVLNFNQSGALTGNLNALAITNLPLGSGNVFTGTSPVTTAVRVFVITYFLRLSPDGTYRLMRQVNGQAPSPVAENLENLQFTYDIFDDTSGMATAGLADAGLSLGIAPSQVRKINYSLTCKTTDIKGAVIRLSLASSASARSLSFKDRYD